MKKNIIKSSFLAGLISLLFSLSSVKDSTLPDIVKPYLGEYECKNVTFDGVNYLNGYDYIRLELKDDENFILSYAPKSGDKKTVEGKYSYDKESQTICFQTGEGIKRKFPLEKGKIKVSFPIAQKMLVITFEQK